MRQATPSESSLNTALAMAVPSYVAVPLPVWVFLLLFVCVCVCVCFTQFVDEDEGVRGCMMEDGGRL